MNSEKLACHEVARILSDGLDAELPPAQRARLRLHLAICEACRNVEQQFGLLRRLVRRDEPTAPPTPAEPHGGTR
jgi:predicted anti-sigma-YlaC factor YlaD